jgi:hypothetical protein
VHFLPYVLRRIEARLARVDADPDPDSRLREAGHRLLHCDHGLARRSEGVEEPVPGRVDLVAGVAGECRPDDPPLLVERGEIGIAAELAQQARRALHVGEHQRDGPRRLHSHPHIISHARAAAKKL